MKEDLREQIRRMEQDLLSEEFLEDDAPGASAAPDPDRAMYADEDYRGPEQRKAEKVRKSRALRYLLLLGILALIGWWIKWML